jgi:hypothetical protein
MDDAYQPLEMALLNLSKEVNKQKGRTEVNVILVILTCISIFHARLIK